MMKINESDETIFVCRHCGEEYASLSAEVTDINNGVELWLEQELKCHLQFCIGDDEEDGQVEDENLYNNHFKN